MNIFAVHNDPVIAARMLCDKHVVKMPTEPAQMLCGAFYAYTDTIPPYKKTHFNNRYSKWARTSLENFNWLLQHGLALTEEHKRRYGRKHYHKARTKLLWCEENKQMLSFPHTGLTPFVHPTKEQFCVTDPIQSYRNLYLGEKKSFATWKNTNKPDWWIEQ